LEGETAKVHRLVKVPVGELETWDAEHDVLGQRVTESRESGVIAEDKENGSDEFSKGV
jgi:hypothetical protein